VSATELPTARGAAIGRQISIGLYTALYKVRLHGTEHVPKEGPVLLAPNHTGFIDAPMLVGVSPRPVHALAKRELFRGPLGWLLHGVGQIPIDRNGPDRAALMTAMKVLDNGRVLGIFPEGTRGVGDFSELRSGLVWFAMRTGAPVVPLVFTGTAGRSSTLGGMPRLRSRIDVTFGAPIRVEASGRGRAALDAATEQLRDGLLAHVAAVYERQQERES